MASRVPLNAPHSDNKTPDADGMNLSCEKGSGVLDHCGHFDWLFVIPAKNQPTHNFNIEESEGDCHNES